MAVHAARVAKHQDQQGLGVSELKESLKEADAAIARLQRQQATLTEEQMEELESLQEEAESLRMMLPQIAKVHRQVEDKLGAAEAAIGNLRKQSTQLQTQLHHAAAVAASNGPSETVEEWLLKVEVPTSSSLLDVLDELGVGRPADFLELDPDDVALVCETLKKVPRRKLDKAIAALPEQIRTMKVEAVAAAQKTLPQRRRKIWQVHRGPPAHERLYNHQPKPAKQLTPRPKVVKRSAAALRRAQEQREAARKAAKEARKQREEARQAQEAEKAAAEAAVAKRRKAAAARNRRLAARQAANEKATLPSPRNRPTKAGQRGKQLDYAKGKRHYDSLGREQKIKESLQTEPRDVLPPLNGWEPISTHTPRSPTMLGNKSTREELHLPKLSAHACSTGDTISKISLSPKSRDKPQGTASKSLSASSPAHSYSASPKLTSSVSSPRKPSPRKPSPRKISPKQIDPNQTAQDASCDNLLLKPTQSSTPLKTGVSPKSHAVTPSTSPEDLEQVHAVRADVTLESEDFFEIEKSPHSASREVENEPETVQMVEDEDKYSDGDFEDDEYADEDFDEVSGGEHAEQSRGSDTVGVGGHGFAEEDKKEEARYAALTAAKVKADMNAEEQQLAQQKEARKAKKTADKMAGKEARGDADPEVTSSPKIEFPPLGSLPAIAGSTVSLDQDDAYDGWIGDSTLATKFDEAIPPAVEESDDASASTVAAFQKEEMQPPRFTPIPPSPATALAALPPLPTMTTSEAFSPKSYTSQLGGDEKGGDEKGGDEQTNAVQDEDSDDDYVEDFESSDDDIEELQPQLPFELGGPMEEASTVAELPVSETADTSKLVALGRPLNDALDQIDDAIGGWSDLQNAEELLDCIADKLPAGYNDAWATAVAETRSNTKHSGALSRLVRTGAVVDPWRGGEDEQWHCARRKRLGHLVGVVGLKLDAITATLLDAQARGVILRSEVAANCRPVALKVTVARASLLADTLPLLVSHFQNRSESRQVVELKPYFRSEHGEKLVSSSPGTSVEEAEGHGPLKEFFHLAGSQLSASLPLLRKTADAKETKLQRNEEDGVFGFEIGEVSASSLNFSASASSFGEGPDLPDGSTNTEMTRTVVEAANGPSLFEYHRGLEGLWFSKEAVQQPDAVDKYRAFGTLLASALNAGCTLGVAIPELLLRVVLAAMSDRMPWEAGTATALEILAQYDPEIEASAKRVLKLSDQEFDQLLETDDTEQDSQAVTWPRPVEPSPGRPRERYVERMLRQCVLPVEVAVACRSVGEGLQSALSERELQEFSVGPAELRELLCGPISSVDPLAAPTFSLRGTFLVMEDAELKETPALQKALWRVLDEFEPMSRRRKLLEFLTGVDRLPAQGTEPLRIEMPFTCFGLSAKRQALRQLPQAHTCTNALELPNYWDALNQVEAEDKRPLDAAAVGFSDGIPPGWVEGAAEDRLTALLRLKLITAVDGCSGYGLDTN